MDGILTFKRHSLRHWLPLVILVAASIARTEPPPGSLPVFGTTTKDGKSDPSQILDIEEEEDALVGLPPLEDPEVPLPGIKPPTTTVKGNAAKSQSSPPLILPKKPSGPQKVHKLQYPGGEAKPTDVTQVPAPLQQNDQRNLSAEKPLATAPSSAAPAQVPDPNDVLFIAPTQANTSPPASTPPSQAAAATPKSALPQAVTPTLAGAQTLPFVLAPSYFAPPPPLPAATTPAVSVPPSPPVITEKIAQQSTPMVPMPGVPDVAVILANNQFYPSRIKLRDGMQTRLIFATINKRPAALVFERLQIQRWIAKEEGAQAPTENDRIRFEATREVTSSRITEIVLEPKRGIYSFHDAMTGATGEIIVE
jgi:hypothetical protein